jgi:hypothetical protein
MSQQLMSNNSPTVRTKNKVTVLYIMSVALIKPVNNGSVVVARAFSTIFRIKNDIIFT